MSGSLGQKSGCCRRDVALDVWASKNGVVRSMSSSVGANAALTFASNRCCLFVSDWCISCQSRKDWSPCSSAIAGESSHSVVGANSPQLFAAFQTSLIKNFFSGAIESFFSGTIVTSIVLHTPSFWMVVRMACVSLEDKKTG